MRASGLALAAAALFSLETSSGSPSGRPLFSLRVPAEMVTGRVEVRVVAGDANVRAVRWTVDDWSRVTPPPFVLSFDAGPVPYERRILAVALDEKRRPLYRDEATLNPGGRRVGLDFLTPLDGERTSGRIAVQLGVTTPPDDEVASVTLEAAGRTVPLASGGGRVLQGVADVPDEVVPLVARLRTRLGREMERTVVVNAPGISAAADVHVVEMLVGVSSRGHPVEGLGPEDFAISEAKGTCEVRDAALLRDAPLAIGFALDVSVSLRHTAELRKATADVFVERCFTPKDSAFVMAFGPAVTTPLDWTRSKERLRETILALEGYEVPGTELFEAVQAAIYRFQGSSGARALILVTDGYDYDGDVTEEAAVAYARQSGIRIFAIGLTSSATRVPPTGGTGPDGPPGGGDPASNFVVVPSNREVLERIADASGGKVYLVTDADQLPGIYRSIEYDLRTQYLVSFVSAARHSGTFHPVEVRCRRGSVRSAAGFFY